MKNYIGLICARGGSKGLPGKNIRPLAGKPLIAWSIQSAKAVPAISRVIVSTDSSEIASVASLYGAEVPFLRPSELAQDNSPEWAVWRHCLDFLRDEREALSGLIVLPPTAPLRSREDVERAIEEFEQYDADVVITVTDSHRNPYFNMVKKDSDGYASLVNVPQTAISRRQDVPVVFDMTTVAYVARPSFVVENGGIFGGKVRAVHVPRERAVDIDDALDFSFAEFLLHRLEKQQELPLGR